MNDDISDSLQAVLMRKGMIKKGVATGQRGQGVEPGRSPRAVGEDPARCELKLVWSNPNGKPARSRRATSFPLMLVED